MGPAISETSSTNEIKKADTSVQVERLALCPAHIGTRSARPAASAAIARFLTSSRCSGYPPMSQAKWARVESSVNLEASGNPDPYFMSLDLATARHPQWQLATHQRSAPYRGSWSTAPSVGACETWFEECEGHYQHYVCRGRAKRLLGRAWIFPLRRNLTPVKEGNLFLSSTRSVRNSGYTRKFIYGGCFALQEF